MEVFRISSEKYANSLISSGAANRWNHDNEFVIYAGSSRSLSTLELVVNLSKAIPTVTYKVMVISIADHDALYTQITENQLPVNWRTTTAYPQLQDLGSQWYNSNISLILKVPSAIIPKEHNYIINTKHPNFTISAISLVRLEGYFWDDRLFT